MSGYGGQLRRGVRVQFVGLSGNAAGPIGTVRGITREGVLVRWTDGRDELVHPDDVRAVAK
jgi:hypothetical protein